MAGSRTISAARRLLSDYGMILVLLALAAYYSYATCHEQFPVGADAGRQVAEQAAAAMPPGTRVLVVSQKSDDANDFVRAAAESLRARKLQVVGEMVADSPRELRTELDKLADDEARRPAALAVTREASQWLLVQSLGKVLPQLAATKVLAPVGHGWPDFLTKANLLAVADRIVVIAVIAIGMTMVIITGGIDLSVGSLIALSAVIAATLIRDLAGGESAGIAATAACCLAAMALCAAAGLCSGLLVTLLEIPPFIVTLGMMLVASGLAFMLAGGESIYDVPRSIDWLGRGSSLWHLPNTVVLMAVLYVGAHLLMGQTVFGRNIYAVGGNIEAARLSGVPVRPVIVAVYAISGLLAGLGGVVQASQLRTGAPTFGLMYELYVIAAVVVGGASLSGGQGRIFGTLIGALVIAVIQNGMNLTSVSPHAQKVVLGMVILLAVTLDMLKKRPWWPGLTAGLMKALMKVLGGQGRSR